MSTFRLIDRARPTLRVGGPIVAAYYALIAFAHTAMLPPEHVVVMTTVAALSCVYATVVSVLAYRDATSERAVAIALELLMFVIMGNSVLHIVRMPDPIQSTNILIALVGVSLLSRYRLVVAGIALFAATGLFVAASNNPDPQWAHFGFAFIATAVVASIVFFRRLTVDAAHGRAQAEIREARERLEAATVEALQSEQRYRTLFAACPYAIFGVVDGRIQYTNPAAEVLVDLRSGTLVGTAVGTFRPHGRGPVLGDDVPSLTLLDSHDREVHVIVHTIQVVVDGAPAAVVFARDRSAEMGSQALQDAFIRTVNHELRTPLTSLMGSIRMLSQRNDDPHDAALLEVAERNANRLASLVESLLTLRTAQDARIQAKRILPLSQILEHAIEGLPHADRIDIQVQSDATVRADPNALGQALRHLVDNAGKFDDTDQRIEIRVTVESDGVRIYVADRGPGIPRRYRERVFHEFKQQHDGLTRPHGGFGVGLSIARAVIAQHGGRLLLLDRDGGGSIACVVLPVYDAAAAAG